MESSLEQLKLRFSAQENIIHVHSRIFVYALLSGTPKYNWKLTSQPISSLRYRHLELSEFGVPRHKNRSGIDSITLVTYRPLAFL
jgi:hypothetical protein